MQLTAEKIDEAKQLASILLADEEIIHNLQIVLEKAIFDGKMNAQKSGFGEDFWQYREFENAHDAQSIDWRASAKSDRLFVRENQRQSPNQIAFWLDLSSQMFLKYDKKLRSKANIGAILAIAFARALKKLGNIVKVGGQKSNTADFIDSLLQKGNGLPIFNSKCPYFLICDGLRPMEYWQNLFENAKQFNTRVFVLCVQDKYEIDFPFDGQFNFRDPNDLSVEIKVNDCSKIQDEYQNAISNHFEELRQLCNKFHFDLEIIRNDDDLTASAKMIWHSFNKYLLKVKA